MLPNQFSVIDDGVALNRVARYGKFNTSVQYFRNEYQIHYIMEGTRYFFINRHQYRMSPKTLALVDKYQIPKTNIIGGEHHDRVLMEIQEHSFGPIAEAVGFDLAAFFAENHGVHILTQSQQIAVESAMEEIVTEIGSDRPWKHTKVQLRTLELLLYLGRADTARASLTTAGAKLSKDLKVHEIADYMQEHYAEIRSLDTLAKRFYLDKCYLSRIFKEITNFTVSEYLNIQRIHRAKELLRETALPVQQIAQELGYKSLTYFERVFHAQTSASPLKYRRTHKPAAEKARPVLQKTEEIKPFN